MTEIYIIIGVAIYLIVVAWSVGYFAGRGARQRNDLEQAVDANGYVWICSFLWPCLIFLGLIKSLFKRVLIPAANLGFRFGRELERRQDEKAMNEEAAARIIKEIDEELKPKPLPEPKVTISLRTYHIAPGWNDDIPVDSIDNDDLDDDDRYMYAPYR